MRKAYAKPKRKPRPSNRRVHNPVIHTGSVYEVRLFLCDGTVVSGYFDSERALYKAVKPYDGKVEGIYNTLNPIKPKRLGHAINSLVIKATNLTKAPDIRRRLWLFLDADVVRPKGTPKRSSTDAEHQAARDKALAIKTYLLDIGWSDPVETDSGNGAHLLYPIDLPNDEDSTDVIRKILEYLADKFDDLTIKIDRGVYEANRIIKLYGTMACKGANGSDRPWRRSAIVECPKQIKVVSADQLKMLAAMPRAEKKAETRGRPRKDDWARRLYTLEDVKGMLAVIPADDRDDWLAFGIILGREFKQSDEAWAVYEEWAEKWIGIKAQGHDKAMRTMFYTKSRETHADPVGLGTIIKKALEYGWAPTTGTTPKEDFVFVAAGNNYLYRRTDDYWVAAAVDAAVSPVNVEEKIVKASAWLKQYRLVTSLACDPLIEEYVCEANYVKGVVVPAAGAAVLNLYRRPTLALGDATKAGPFLKHVKKLLQKPGDAKQFLDYLAHRVQKPGEKPRFALLMAGEQGTGKDTAVEFCVPAIGEWNVANIEPAAFDSAFNEYAAATLVRISETSNLHEMSKWAFNERTKVLIAGLPDFCVVNPKYGQKFSVRLFCGVILTTNNLLTGIFIPPDDRRYDVLACATLKEMGLEEEKVRRTYFEALWGWFLDGGRAHVAAYLHEHNLQDFSASNGQRKTAAHQMVVQVNRASDHWLSDILDWLGSPDQVRSDWIIDRAFSEGEKKGDVARKITSAMSRLGYVWFRNPNDKEGRWSFPSPDARQRALRSSVYVKEGTKMELDEEKLKGDKF